MSWTTGHRRTGLALAITILASLLVAAGTTSAGEDLLWDKSPYNVEIRVALVGGPTSATDFRESVLRRLRHHLDYRVSRIWKHRLVPVGGEQVVDVRSVLEARQPAPDAVAAVEAPGPDKLICALAEYVDGEFRVRSREFDNTLGVWSETTSEYRCDGIRLADGIFAAVLSGFRPLARFDIDKEDERRVVLTYRGAALSQEAALVGAPPEEVLTPYRVRFRQTGEVEDAKRIPWTHLVALPVEDKARPPAALVYSHSRRPFGSRRRGRVAQIAIVAKADKQQPTRIWLHALNDPDTPLAGYELLVGEPGAAETRSVGRSDSSGSISAPPSDSILMAHIKCGSLVVASFPIAPGVDRLLEAPLLDERQRLKAELRLGALREQLIDLVARRSIYAARIRKLLAEDQVDEAERLIRELETLPGRAQFNQRLNAAEQSLKADHPLVQRRIDRLLSETRSVLGASLDARQVRRLAEEVSRAQRDAEARGSDSTGG